MWSQRRRNENCTASSSLPGSRENLWQAEMELKLRRVSRAIMSGVDAADKVKCTGCDVTFSVYHGEANDVAI